MGTITLTGLAALLGMVLGTAGFVISLMNYLRDRAKVRVFLKWDMVETQNSANKIGIVRVTNEGRRPIYISVAAVTVPKGFEHTHLVLKQSMQGTRLSEADAPATFIVNYKDLAKYAEHWRELRGYAEDVAGRKYVSKRLPKSEIPSWAK